MLNENNSKTKTVTKGIQPVQQHLNNSAGDCGKLGSGLTGATFNNQRGLQRTSFKVTW